MIYTHKVVVPEEIRKHTGYPEEKIYRELMHKIIEDVPFKELENLFLLKKTDSKEMIIQDHNRHPNDTDKLSNLEIQHLTEMASRHRIEYEVRLELND